MGDHRRPIWRIALPLPLPLLLLSCNLLLLFYTIHAQANSNVIHPHTLRELLSLQKDIKGSPPLSSTAVTVTNENSNSNPETVTTAVDVIDLHSHTTISDGADTPKQLVQRAHEAGVTVLAITDHDQLSYDEDAISYGLSHGMRIIRGTELSCEWTFHSPEMVEVTGRDGKKKQQLFNVGKVHLLGYFTHQVPSSPLGTLLLDLQQKRAKRNLDILLKLKDKFNLDITPEMVIEAGSRELEANKQAGKKESSSDESDSPPPPAGGNETVSIEYFGRPHIAKAIIAAGHAKSMSEVFLNYLSDEKLQLDPWSLDFSVAVKAIDFHGGVAVLAHPVTIGLALPKLEQELDYLINKANIPLRGLEVYSSKHTADESAALLGIAERLKLVPTGGSDYHGKNKDNVPLAAFGKLDAATDSTQRWGKINHKSLTQLEKLREMVRSGGPLKEATISSVPPPTPSKKKKNRSSASGEDEPGSVESVTSILSQIAAYAFIVGLLMFGVQLYESPTVASGTATSKYESIKFALIRFVKSNSITQWLFGSSIPSSLPFGQLSYDLPLKLRSSPATSYSTIASKAASPLPSSSPDTPLSPIRILPISSGRPVARIGTAIELQPILDSPSSNGADFKFPTQTTSPPPQSPRQPTQRSTGQWLFCFIGLQLSYLSWGYLQERIMTIEYENETHAAAAAGGATHVHTSSERFNHSEFLVLMNRIFGGIIAVTVALIQRIRLERQIRRDTDQPIPSLMEHLRLIFLGVRVTPPYKYSLCSISNVLSSWFQYEALKYVSFPLQVLSKSSKILFTMLAGRLVEKKVFPKKEYVMAGLIAVGLVLFRIGEHISSSDIHDQEAHATGLNLEPSKSTDLPTLTAQEQQLLTEAAHAVNGTFLHCLGLLLLLGYIFADSFTSTWQSRIFTQHRISSIEMMIGVNLFSSIISIVIMIAFDKLVPAIIFAFHHPTCLLHAALMSLFSAVGQLFIFHTISTFGAVTFASMMTARQLFSLVLSISAFNHHVHTIGYCGLVLVFVSLTMKILEDMKKSGSKKSPTTTRDEETKNLSSSSATVPSSMDSNDSVEMPLLKVVVPSKESSA